MASVSAVLQRSSSRAREYLRLQSTAARYSVALHLVGCASWWWRCGSSGKTRARAAHGMAGSGEEDNGVVAGGVEDAYGEDRATEDQPITPWAVCVARYTWGVSFSVPPVMS
jgi:malate dehydrogenase (oxaloacetate-decarboxylating)(NADP+)